MTTDHMKTSAGILGSVRVMNGAATVHVEDRYPTSIGDLWSRSRSQSGWPAGSRRWMATCNRARVRAGAGLSRSGRRARTWIERAS
jgi:hypothetical protein